MPSMHSCASRQASQKAIYLLSNSDLVLQTPSDFDAAKARACPKQSLAGVLHLKPRARVELDLQSIF